jgi:uncharacterized repeat protein (TIGR01451 family)
MRRISVFLLIALGLVVVRTPAHADTGITLRLTINKIHQIESPDSTGDGNYFPEIRIGDGGLQRRTPVEDDDFNPSVLPDPWIFTQDVQVPDDTTKVPVLIRLWDEDGGVSGGDDKLDISPQNQDDDLELVYDIATDTWTDPGDLLTPGQGYVEGDGDPNFPNSNDGKRAGIGFTIERLGGSLPDTDGDGIPDVIERLGIHNPDGSMLYDLKAMGANPCRKTVIVQVDYMDGAADGHTHKPKDAAIEEVKRAFEDAPVDAAPSCPYPGFPTSQGIDFIHVPGVAIPEQAVMSENSNAFRTARTANFNSMLAPFAHYAIFGHDLAAGSASSGSCCEPNRGNHDFIVTLGSWRTRCVGPGDNDTLETTASGDDVVIGKNIGVGPNRTCDTAIKAGSDDEQTLKPTKGADNAEVGTVRDQAGSLMHELGHSLGLSHGGDSRTNYKPNYLSVMNYAFDPGGIPTGTDNSPHRLDYSRSVLPQLDTDHLDEGKGISDGDDYTRWRLPGAKTKELFGPGTGWLDWNDNKKQDPPTIAADINSEDDVCVLAGANGTIDSTRMGDDTQFNDAIIQGPDGKCQSTPSGDDTGRTKILTGYDDWSHLKYGIAGSGGGSPSGPEIDFPTVARMETEFHNFYSPDLATTKTVDKATALPGDTLTYTVKVDNVGKGAATAVKVTDTLPDGTKDTRTLPDLAAAETHNETFSYAVPCTTADGTALINTATSEAKNLANGPEENTDNNTGKATSTIKAPKLTLAATSTPTANAGEAVTTTLTVANTGGANAAGTTLTYTLPAGVYYSTTLDQGSGPKPTSVSGATLTWQLGSLDAGATTTVRFTTRSSLLTVGGTALTGQAKVSYRNANGCAYDPVTASATSTVTEVAPSRDPRPQAIWLLSTNLRTPELLARVQATDTRYDGIDGTTPDGQLSQREVSAAFNLPVLQPRALQAELLTAYLNLGSRRINAATRVTTITLERLGLHTVGDAARHGQTTLALPPAGNTIAYTDATLALVEIDTGIAERY